MQVTFAGMVWRWVEMPAQAEKVPLLREKLLAQAPHTRNFPGCLHLQLFYQPEGPTFYSLSQWESLEALERYRASTLFRTFWGEIRPYFRAKPRAQTLQPLS